MARSRKLTVMLSSRCKDLFPGPGGRSLSDIRADLKKEIEGATVLGRQIFDVWINEDAPPAEGRDDSWDHCLEQVKDCDILIVLSNGNAGWAKSGSDIGICHAEFMLGLAINPGKVRLVALPDGPLGTGDTAKRNQRFRDELGRQTPFRGGEVKSEEELKKRIREALADAIVILTQRGVTADSSIRNDTGAALEWSRLDFLSRKSAMEKALQSALLGRPGSARLKHSTIVKISDTAVCVRTHAIPASLSVAAAREMVGRPFLKDHEHVSDLAIAFGPVHVVACHKTVSESQAGSLLGFPDATVIAGRFGGVYVADDIQKIQFVLLANCRDETHTRHALQRFLEWLEQTDEAGRVVARAKSRAKIVKLMAAERDKI